MPRFIFSVIHLYFSQKTDNELWQGSALDNGTVLNGEAMVPYKEYILNDGDTFKIAGVSYAYRLGSFKSSANAS
ncbi:fha domain containing protein [Paenibacillus terrae HPL-003]|uniref:Fha domain containing protein n=1 Tax=Paenibacillus terrae (strain HPL-003) TaxID=985665 RepID=G7W2A7_PAETH|nr:fha domain containing protein [Paenibacillus terrae HPL-003]